MENTGVRMKKCNFCGEDISFDSGRCPYCGSLLDMAIEGEKSFHQPEFNRNMHFSPDSQIYNIQRNQVVLIDDTRVKKPLGNSVKVFFTVICTIIPGFGQLAGVIIGILFMNSEDEKSGEDKKSFGLALIIASIVMFILTCIFWLIVLVALSVPFEQ